MGTSRPINHFTETYFKIFYMRLIITGFAYAVSNENH